MADYSPAEDCQPAMSGLLRQVTQWDLNVRFAHELTPWMAVHGMCRIVQHEDGSYLCAILDPDERLRFGL